MPSVTTSAWLTFAVIAGCSRPAPVEPEPIAADAAVSLPPDAPVIVPGVIRTRFIKIEVVGGDQIGTLSVGSNHGISKEWTVCLLRGSTDACLSVGALAIVAVEPRLTRVHLRMTEAAELVSANPFVQLTAPP